MTVLNRSFAIVLRVLLVPFCLMACATVPDPLLIGERPAEINLPPTLQPGNLDQIRRDLQPFRRGQNHSHTRGAKCAGCVVEVEIRSIGLTTDIRPIDGPAKFRIVGRLKNNDSQHDEELYSLKANAEYLMWVAPARLNRAGSSRTIWGFLELPPGSTGEIRPDTVGYVELCGHPRTLPPWTSDTDFKLCDDVHSGRSSLPGKPGVNALTFFTTSDGSSSRLSFPRPGWFDCGGVCCTGTKITQ